MKTIADRKRRAELLEVKRSVAEIRRDRLEFDKGQTAVENEIKRERLAFDRTQAASERKFWESPAGTRATAFVSAVAVLVTLTIGASNVWVSKITKDKEIEVSRIQKQLELDKLDAQKKREWDLILAQFLLSNQKAIFNGTSQEQKVLAKIIPTIFPEDISVALLERLEKASPAPTKVIWSQARTSLETADTGQVKETVRVEAAPVPSSRPYSGIASFSVDSQAY
jgi:hypothetical protein